MSKRAKRWVFNPPKPKIPERLKADVEKKSAELIDAVLKPRYIQPPPAEARFNYVVDIYTRWYRSHFYFCAQYACPGPNAITPFFEAKFARMEYVGGDDRFNLSFMRHTEKWQEIYQNLSLEESLTAIRDDPWFQP